VLFINERRATILRVPSFVGLLLGMLALLVLGEWRKAPYGWTGHASWLSAAIAVVLVAGTKVIRRAGAKIIVRGIFGAKVIDARRARIGVAVRSTSRYSGIDLDLMTGEHFELNAVVNRAVNIETFMSEGLGGPMRAARRVARVLQLGEPLLAPGLVDNTAREPPA
jgi:hypothetical protein